MSPCDISDKNERGHWREVMMLFLPEAKIPYRRWLLRASVWMLRFTLLMGLLTIIAPPDVRVLLDPPQAVDAVHEHVCVHTRLIDEVEEWVIQRSLQMVREMGADTIVEFFPWAYIERERGRYHWDQADTILRHADNQGLTVIARMGFVPEWARPDQRDDPTTLNYLPDESFDDFARFVAVFAERYTGIVDQIIIWNEPNLAFEWGYRPVNPADYARLLQAVYEPVKQANPNVMILGGALAPTLETEGSIAGLNDLAYLEGLYNAGAAPYFDALAVHTYGFALPPEDTPDAETLNFRRAELLYDIMARYGDAGKPVYITETGWNDHPRWVLAVRPSQRIAYTIDALDYSNANWPQVDKMCIWAFRYPLPTLSYPDNFTLVTTDFQTRPIYNAIQAYARGEERNGALWLPPPQTNQ